MLLALLRSFVIEHTINPPEAREQESANLTRKIIANE